MTSFYDLDYNIQLNEKRMEQYNSAYEKYLGRFTILLVLYSAFTIFLVPIVQLLYSSDTSPHWMYFVSFYAFAFLLVYSLFYTVKLLIPTDVKHLMEPKVYYETHKSKYENEVDSSQEVDALLKAAFIHELQVAVNANRHNLIRKTTFYRNAFSLAVCAVIPYLVCVGFHVCMKNESIHKVEVVNKFINFIKTNENGKQ